MDIFSIDLSVGEIGLLRQSLDLITITGKDAKFVANLQTKLEQEMAAIQQMQQQANAKKKAELNQLLESEKKRKATTPAES